MHTLRLAFQMLRRDLRAGELSLLGIALFVAVLALTSVSFVTGRVEQALARDATQLLGADALISADHSVPASIEAEAARLGLRMAHSITFNSMATTEAGAQLAAVKAIEAGHPLRGSLLIANQPGEPGREAGRIPVRGETWVDEQLLNTLQLKPGDMLELGYLKLRIGALVTYESDRGMGFSSFSPRVLINAADLPASGLLVEGSRARYRLLLAGDLPVVKAFEAWAKPKLGRGEELESLDNARPELRSGLDRAGRFLRLTAMLAVVLAAVAIGLSARRYLMRHLDGAAVMRCVGARRGQLLALYLYEFLGFAVLVSAFACLAGFGVQAVLAQLALSLVKTALPAPGWLPVLHGLLVGLVLTLGFVLPQLLRLTGVPPIRALRREWGEMGAGSSALWAIGAAALAGLLLWMAGDWKLGLAVVGGFSVAIALFVGVAWLLLGLLGRTRAMSVSWGLRYGIAALYRRRASSVIQVVALALGLACILLLGLVSQDLLAGWRKQQAPDAPNRFVIGIQPEQRVPLADTLVRNGLPANLQPMIRGRLMSINGRPVSASDYPEERARNLVEREFNLSQGSAFPAGNTIVSGAWHGEAKEPVFSMEQGVGKTLGIQQDDRVEFQIAGQRVSGRVGSVRKLDWDSMRVNFFFIAAPGLLDQMPASYITSFHLAPEKTGVVRELVGAFPNINVIDVAAVLAQIESFAGRLASMVQFVFAFALCAGIIVLLAAQQSTHDERSYEIAILRALGARNHQVRSALLAEFAALAGLAVLLAGLAALGIGWGLAHFVFEMDFAPRLGLLALSGVAALAVIVGFGWLGVRGVLRQPALEGIRAAL
ncbi:FtsX-like permease family protein [Uliginosibacterium sp. 31-16]|uniref:ABC transporter permease n=1 Tax=Uliginosibacterium sp. 31-16 TaxID=3068315 RepID=UPI00273E13A0|nr:FtsX-like permease family protein [Uliginosibacterium sp. 31-16]MDP5240326.1 FtsX-like permease family protein [Uliginosibacterium sp. 31-16]